MLATDYARYYNLPPQAENESDTDFRSRTALALREQGKIIEAHEPYQDAYYDQNSNVMTGIMGAVVQALQNRHYSGDPIFNDIAVGTIVQNPKATLSPEEVLLAILLEEK